MVSNCFFPAIAEETQRINVDLDSPYGDAEINIDDYQFVNPFGELEGIYYGVYFPVSIYSPYIFADEMYYTQEIYFSPEITGSGVSHFYIMSIFYSTEYERLDIISGDVTMEVLKSFYINGIRVYDVRGIFPVGNYTLRFYTNDTNSEIFTTDEIIHTNSSYLFIDDTEYEIDYDIAIRVLLIDGASGGMSYLPVTILPNSSFSVDWMYTNKSYTDDFQIYIPCYSKHIYNYSAYSLQGAHQWESSWVDGSNNHHITINRSKTVQPSGISYNYFTFYISNNYNFDITVYFYLQPGGFQEIRYYVGALPADYADIPVENIMGSLVFFEKAIPYTGDFYDDFDSETLGDPPDNWNPSTTQPPDTLEIAAGELHAGNYPINYPHALEMEKGLGVAATINADISTLPTDHWVSLYFYVCNTSSTRRVGTQQTTGDYDTAKMKALIEFKSTGDLYYYSDNTAVDTGIDYYTGWHWMEIQHRYSDDTYTLYMGGIQIAQNVPCYKQGLPGDDYVRSIQIYVSNCDLFIDKVMVGDRYTNSTFYKAWRLIDISPYKNYTKQEFLTFFASIQSILQINDQTLTITSTSDEARADIGDLLRGFFAATGEGLNQIVGFISSIAQTIYNTIIHMGEYIYNAIKSFVGFILSIITQIINLVEIFISEVTIPIISFFLAYLSIMGMGNIILNIKRHRIQRG